MATPILAMTGAAIDYSGASSRQVGLQAAVDAAALATNRQMASKSDGELREMAADIIAANLGGDNTINISEFVVDRNNHKVAIGASMNSHTSFLGLLGINDVEIGARAETATGIQSLDAVLVLDNSGSMAGSRIASLKEAAELLTDTLFGDYSTHPKIKMGIVPFAATVNVGTEHEHASWMDQAGRSSVHGENLPWANRWQLFDKLQNVDWGGCVASRPHPYDVNDAPATNSDPDTLYVPHFAPDEVDGSYYYINNYISDEFDGDEWAFGEIVSGGDGHGRGDGERNPNNPSATTYFGNYSNLYADTRLAYGSRMGPNHLCDSKPITPLTNEKSEITDGIDEMVAYGGTNMHEGIAWGWRVLSPGEPFTGGAPEGLLDHKRVIVLMSDGRNFHYGNGSSRKSWYSSYGYAVDGHLRDTNRSDELIDEMNDRTLQTCTNAKASGVEIITIAVEIEDEETLKLLKQCASGEDNVFSATSHTQLVSTFGQIATRISDLRLSK